MRSFYAFVILVLLATTVVAAEVDENENMSPALTPQDVAPRSTQVPSAIVSYEDAKHNEKQAEMDLKSVRLQSAKAQQKAFDADLKYKVLEIKQKRDSSKLEMHTSKRAVARELQDVKDLQQAKQDARAAHIAALKARKAVKESEIAYVEAKQHTKNLQAAAARADRADRKQHAGTYVGVGHRVGATAPPVPVPVKVRVRRAPTAAVTPKPTQVNPFAPKPTQPHMKVFYSGCYKDQQGFRAVPHKRGKVGGFFVTGRSTSNKVQCQAYAEQFGDNVFALQNGNECWTGKDVQYDVYGEQKDAKKCGPNGGPNTNQVYTLYL